MPLHGRPGVCSKPCTSSEAQRRSPSRAAHLGLHRRWPSGTSEEEDQENELHQMQLQVQLERGQEELRRRAHAQQGQNEMR